MSNPQDASQYRNFSQQHTQVTTEETDRPLSSHAQLTNNLRYLQFKQIAQGGKCDIQTCKDRHLGRVVCYKTLRREFEDDPHERAMFLREARITAMLQHPNTPPVYEVGMNRKGHYYFTMQLVIGHTFRELIDQYRAAGTAGDIKWGLQRLVDIVLQVAQVLNYAHLHGVVHCDVKPENIVVGEYGDVLLLDWGLAHVQQDVPEDPKAAELPISGRDREPKLPPQGTPLYMSPEQIQGEDVDQRTDVYSLGAILFEILTHQSLGWGDSMHTLLENRVTAMPPAPSILAPERDIPMALDTLCWRCIQRDSKERVQTVLEVIHELLYWLWVESSHRPV